MILDCAAAFLYWRNQGFNHFKAILKAELDFTLNLKTYWKKRDVESSCNVKLNHDVKSVVLKYFLFNEKTYNDLSQ